MSCNQERQFKRPLFANSPTHRSSTLPAMAGLQYSKRLELDVPEFSLGDINGLLDFIKERVLTTPSYERYQK